MITTDFSYRPKGVNKKILMMKLLNFLSIYNEAKESFGMECEEKIVILRFSNFFNKKFYTLLLASALNKSSNYNL